MAKFVKGLNKDAGHVDQPEGSYRYAKNMLSNETAGALSNEPGTRYRNSLFDDDEKVIGSIETTDDIVILFTVDTQGRSRIYLYDTQIESLSVILQTTAGNVVAGNDVDLKFSEAYPIEGTYKIDPDSNLIVYWTDNLNPPRSLNVTRQNTLPFNNTQIYNVNPALSPNKNYIDRLNLFPHSGPVPSITFTQIAEGGALKSGVYYLFLAYVDANFTQTNYVSYSLGVPIVEDTEAVLPIERYDGSPADTQTGKSIVWTATNLNTDYEYLRPIVVARVGGVEKAYKLNDLDISGTSRTIVFSLLEGYEESSVEEAIIDTVAYDRAKTITQLDSILYLGNLAGSKDIGFQKHANFIKLKTVTTTLDPFDPYDISSDNLMYGFLDTEAPFADKEQGYRGIQNLAGANNKKGYMRDEVYAFYIAFVLNDGSMSYAYHIPGREAFEDVQSSAIDKVGSNATLPALINEKDPLDGIDPDLSSMTQGAGKAFHFYDFAATTFDRTNFWENKNEFYPNTNDYDIYDGDVFQGTLQGSNVRHHRMPTNASVPSITNNAADFVPSEDEQIQVYYFAVGNINGGGQSNENIQGTDIADDVVLMNANEATQTISSFQAPDANDAFGTAQDFYGPSNTWVYNTNPPNNQGGFFVWANGNNGGIFGSVSGGGTADALSADQDGIVISQGADPTDGNYDAVVYAIFIWRQVLPSVDQTGSIAQTVEPLGIQLRDIKIPKSIADKVQGFRIYYAERDHTNRRVLGQDVIKNTFDINGIDLGGCEGDGGTNAAEDFILSPGTMYNGEVREATFHDFYLLNGGYSGDDGKGQRKSLVPATHTTLEYNTKFYSFTGPGHDYEDVPLDNTESNCQDPNSFSAFHIGQTYANPAVEPFRHFPIREKCKTYLNGDSIYDGRGIGFGKRVYNLGGESSILLGYKKNRLPNLGAWPDAPGGASWHDLVGPELGFGYSNGNDISLQLHNLQAFKTDMYLSYDTQELIWTGFEVLGDDLANYTLEEDGTSTVGATHTTTDIYGGDTFICRHGYRITHRPEYATVSPKDRKNLIYVICESTDNINFRHETDVDSSYFPGSPAKKLLDIKANVDFTDVDNMDYNKDYSLGVADIKPAIPYPLRESDPSVFETRVQRSAKADNTSLIDNYRVHLALQFKDLPRNRGSLWKLIPLNNLLYLHTEDSLFRTKGKQSLQLSDGTESFVGGGDIFAQDPDEIIQTKYGYGGTQSQWVSMVTKHGYFCMDYRNRRVFLMKDQLYDIGKTGLESWFQDNIPYELEQYGLPPGFDNPIAGIGFHAEYDEKYDRILLTKKDLKPVGDLVEWLFNAVDNQANSQQVIAVFDEGLNKFVKQYLGHGDVLIKIPLEFSDTEYFEPTGWTVSYDVEMNYWASFHDYLPYKYSRFKDSLMSFNLGSRRAWIHDSENSRGRFYDVDYPTEFEFIYNAGKDLDKVFYSFNYMVDVFNDFGALVHDHGFDSFYVYNTHQISGEQDIEYMINTRRIGNEWKINKFRDLALLQQTAVGPFAGSNFGVPGASVAGTNLTSVETTTPNTMFSVIGMNETINPLFIDLAKSWDKQRKFSDKWLGIRLKYSNSNKKLINLYSTDVAAKKFYR